MVGSGGSGVGFGSYRVFCDVGGVSVLYIIQYSIMEH